MKDARAVKAVLLSSIVVTVWHLQAYLPSVISLTMFVEPPEINFDASNIVSTSTAPSRGKQWKSNKKVKVRRSNYIYGKHGWNTAPMVIESHRLVFFTIPKVGCTVWGKLFRRMMGHEDWKTAAPHNPLTNGLRYLSDYSLAEANTIMNDPLYTKAIFLRDPKERFLSAYLDKIVKEFERLCCKRNNTADKSCLSEAQSFSGFIKVTQTTCKDNDHWMPQSKRMERKFLSKLDFIGHMETVELDSKRLLERIGAWEEFGSTGWGPPTGRIFEGKSMVPHATSTFAEDSWSRLSKYYTPELESLVEEIYKEDYELELYNLTMRKIHF